MTGIVIIGGAAEAQQLAQALPSALVHLPRRERVARDWPGAPSHGAITPEWLAGQGARLVIEAAHPCDDHTAWQVARACAAAGIARLQLVRPEWRAGPRDRWVALRRPQEAAQVIPAGARVFITTGRDILPGFRGLKAHCLVRRIGFARMPFPLKHGRFIHGQGPFTVAQEMALLRRERIDWLLMRNAGGTGGWPKLEAARRLGLPVAMIARPKRPGGPRVDTTDEALAWLSRFRNG